MTNPQLSHLMSSPSKLPFDIISLLPKFLVGGLFIPGNKPGRVSNSAFVFIAYDSFQKILGESFPLFVVEHPLEMLRFQPRNLVDNFFCSDQLIDFEALYQLVTVNLRYLVFDLAACVDNVSLNVKKLSLQRLFPYQRLFSLLFALLALGSMGIYARVIHLGLIENS